jgi:deoxyadenosine/deoxycytidine kinase
VEQLRYIAVEGPIGVGKSSLVKILAEDLGARIILERPDENPFLPLFYAERSKYAFQAQLFFLLSRYRQQVELKQQDLFTQKTVCDYLFAKDHIFAQLNLTDDELGLYQGIFQLLDQRLPKPDATIFLQAETEVLMKRIRKRKKEYEKDIDLDYVRAVLQAYSQFFFQYADAPLLVVNTSGLDFVANPGDYELLKNELVYLIQSGQERHYVTIDQR